MYSDHPFMKRVKKIRNLFSIFSVVVEQNKMIHLNSCIDQKSICSMFIGVYEGVYEVLIKSIFQYSDGRWCINYEHLLKNLKLSPAPPPYYLISEHVQYSFSQRNSLPTSATDPFHDIEIYSIFISTTKLATNHGSISDFLISKHVQYSFSQQNSLPTLATDPFLKIKICLLIFTTKLATNHGSISDFLISYSSKY